MKVKIINNVEYQTFPICSDMVDIDEVTLQQIGVNKQFDVNTKSVIDYVNPAELLQEKAEIKQQLCKYSEDIIQFIAGENVPNIQQIKKDFILLHNKLRLLEGKEARLYNI